MLEKVVGKTRLGQLIGDHIEKPKGAPTLAKNSDKREKYKESSALEDFRNGGKIIMSLVTGKVRFSYVNVFEPREIGGEKKYSVTLLIPKSDTQTYQNIMAEINKILQESISSVFGGVMPSNPAIPVYDGDGLRPNGEAFGVECKGHWVLSAKSNNAPEVVDAGINPIISKNEFYSGCYGRASIRFYAYNKNGNKGVGCGLGNVQKLEDGQPLDGRTTASEDFGAPVQNQVPYTQSQYQSPVVPTQSTTQQPVMPQFQIDPITGQPAVPQTNVNNIYGVSQ